MNKGLEYLTYKERLTELRLFSVKERKFRRADLVYECLNMYKYLMRE